MTLGQLVLIILVAIALAVVVSGTAVAWSGYDSWFYGAFMAFIISCIVLLVGIIVTVAVVLIADTWDIPLLS